MSRKSPILRIGAILMALAALAFAVSACGDDDSTSASDATSAEDVKPVAQIDDLTGVATEVTLDQGFVDAATSPTTTPPPRSGPTCRA